VRLEDVESAEIPQHRGGLFVVFRLAGISRGPSPDIGGASLPRKHESIVELLDVQESGAEAENRPIFVRGQPVRSDGQEFDGGAIEYVSSPT
jgi:hypothetical protein